MAVILQLPLFAMTSSIVTSSVIAVTSTTGTLMTYPPQSLESDFASMRTGDYSGALSPQPLKPIISMTANVPTINVFIFCILFDNFIF